MPILAFLLPILGQINGLYAHCKIACLCLFLQFRLIGSQFFGKKSDNCFVVMQYKALVAEAAVLYFLE